MTDAADHPLAYGAGPAAAATPSVSDRAKLTPPAWTLSLLLPTLLAGLWWLGSARGWFVEELVPSPGYVWETVGILFDAGDLQRHALATLARVSAGFAFGAVLGVAAGTLLGLSRAVDAWLGDLFAGFAQVPLVGWVPLLILAFGIEESFRVAVIAIAAMFPIALNLQQALKRVPHSYREVADTLALPPVTRLTQFYGPAVLPSFVTGARLGLSKAFMIVVFAELFAASSGLGYLMDNARRQFQMDVVLIGCVSIGILGALCDRLFALLERRLAR